MFASLEDCTEHQVCKEAIATYLAISISYI